MICRYKVFYLFLLTAPFFNIIGLKFGNAIVQVFILIYLSLTLLMYRKQRIRSEWVPLLFVLYAGVICLLMSEAHSAINLGRSNISSIRFFGLFIPVLIVYIFSYNPKVFADKYLDKLLSFYILVFSFSIMIDYVILHSALDISLQPMYSKEDWNYFGRPFGISGQPSVNSVLLVFFYTLVLSRSSFNKSKTLLLFTVMGVLFQGSGSGFIALIMLFFVMFGGFHWLIKALVYACGFLIVAQLVQEFKFLDKISLLYISGIAQVFMLQIDNWIILVNESYPLLNVLFGGVSSNIDFGPLYFMSNVGLIYSILFLMLIVISVVKAKNRYQRFAIFILLVGNLHYPVMFYAIMVFVLPLLLQQIIFPVKENIRFSGTRIV
tara:strand:- start:314 stop:1447 length:1134 start_codon:yes stop_codon:yes gene_type:complete